MGNKLSRIAMGMSWLPMCWVVDVGFGSKEERVFSNFNHFGVENVVVSGDWITFGVGSNEGGGVVGSATHPIMNVRIRNMSVGEFFVCGSVVFVCFCR